MTVAVLLQLIPTVVRCSVKCAADDIAAAAAGVVCGTLISVIAEVCAKNYFVEYCMPDGIAVTVMSCNYY